MNNNEGTTWWAMGLDNTQFEGDVAKSNALFRSIGNTAEGEGSRVDNIFRKLTLTAAGFFTVQQAISYATQIATVRGEFQQLEVAFSTMLGSKYKADALMAQVVDTAAKTPFDLKGVASGAKQLLAYGVASDEVTGRLTQLGNIASGLSIPLNDIVYLYGTTMVQGRLFTQDVRQFMGRGIPLVKELAEELGKTENEINDMVTAGKIGFPEVQKVIDNLTKSGGMFYNLMEEQSKTISGQISNLGDAISSAFNDIGKANEGTINSVLESASYLVDHYKEIGRIVGVLITSYGVYKAAILSYAAAQKIAVAAGNIKAFLDLAKGIKTAKDAQIVLNIAMGANPLLKMASILMTVGGLIWAYAKNTEEATEEVIGLTKAQQKAGDEYDKESAKISALTTVLNNSKVAYDERKRALNELKSIIPDYNAQLDAEGTITNNNTQAIKDYLVQLERQIKMKAVQDELEEAYRQKRAQEKELDKREKDAKEARVIANVASTNTNYSIQKSGMNTGVAVFAKNNAVDNSLKDKANLAEKEAKKVRDSLNITLQTITDLTNEIESSSQATSSSEKSVKTFSEQLHEASLNVSKLKKELSDLKSGKGNQDDYAKAIEEKKAELKEAQKRYSLLSGIEVESSTKSSSKEKKDYSDEIKKNAQEEARIKKDMEFTVRQAQLNTQKDSFSKTMDQNQLNYEQEMEQLRRQKDDKLNKIQEWEKTVWESKGKKGTFTPTTTKLSDEDDKQFGKLEKYAGDKLALSNKTAIDDMLKQYQTYADKRKEIEEKFQKDIAAMRATNEKDKKDGKAPTFSEENIAQAGTDGQEALEALDQEIASREVTFTIWADKIASMGLKQLKSALESARVALEKDGGKVSEKDKAVLRAKIKTLEKQVKTSEAKDASLSSSDKAKKKWGDTLKTMNEVQDTVDNICGSFEGLDDITKTALTAATNIAGGTIAMIMGIQQLAEMAGKSVATVEKASVILAVIGAAVQILSALFSLSSKAEKDHQEALKEIAENKLKMQREYNLLLLEQNLLMKESTSIFGEDKIAKAANAVDVYRDAIAKYKEELKGEAPTFKLNPLNLKGSLDDYKKQKEAYDNGVGALNNVTVKTGSYTTGAWFWKKQHDVMTPVLDVYKDLIDEEGNLNVERAKSIISTQTMSDESKALIQSLIDLQEQAEKAQEELRNYLQDTFGSLGDDIMTSITEAIENDGVNAWEKFGEAGSSVLEDLGKQIAYQLFFSKKFKTLQADLEKIYGSGKADEDIAKDAMNLVSSFYNGIGTDMQNAQNWMQQWKDEANKQGFSLWETSREGSSKGIAAADQESVNELNGRATAIQGHTFIISEAMKELTTKMTKVLEYLAGIQSNTEHCKYLETINGNIKEVKEGIDSMNTKGVNIRR